MNLFEIARMCHEVNRGVCTVLGETQPSWEEAPEWQKESAIRGVEAIQNGLARTPEETHNAWCRDKVADGWNYGAVKDAEAKTHPCLVPYHELPPGQRLKDVLFMTVVKALS